jgi:hypothetical protein
MHQGCTANVTLSGSGLRLTQPWVLFRLPLHRQHNALECSSPAAVTQAQNACLTAGKAAGRCAGAHGAGRAGDAAQAVWPQEAGFVDAAAAGPSASA